MFLFDGQGRQISDQFKDQGSNLNLGTNFLNQYFITRSLHAPKLFKQTLFSPLFHVMHYGPKEFSINKKDVISYVHELPDSTWREPSPTDPLSLIDQVNLTQI